MRPVRPYISRAGHVRLFAVGEACERTVERGFGWEAAQAAVPLPASRHPRDGLRARALCGRAASLADGRRNGRAGDLARCTRSTDVRLGERLRAGAR